MLAARASTTARAIPSIINEREIETGEAYPQIDPRQVRWLAGSVFLI